VDGTFGPAVHYGVGWGPVSLAMGDFNGDGFPDLVTANPGSHSLSVLLNAADGPPGPGGAPAPLRRSSPLAGALRGSTAAAVARLARATVEAGGSLSPTAAAETVRPPVPAAEADRFFALAGEERRPDAPRLPLAVPKVLRDRSRDAALTDSVQRPRDLPALVWGEEWPA
jgi:hypothetical protein